MPSSVMGILKLAEEVLFKESAFIAVDRLEFYPYPCGSV